MNPEIIVVGAGAAGLLAAKRAAELGARVTLLEKNDRVGLKILISGGGQCNLTHDGPMEELRATFRSNEARFLKPSFYRYSNDDFLALLHDEGMSTYARPDGRVFPTEPANAKDVTAVLERLVRRAGVSIQKHSPVSGIVIEHGRIAGVKTQSADRPAHRVIVAVGGSSYPATGTTGDGWRWASDLGHSITSLRAALAPLYLIDSRPDWSGVALRDVVLRARTQTGGKEYARRRGDLLFTHKGLSGPCALGVSREVAERMPHGGEIEVDLAPDHPFEALQAQIRLEMTNNPGKPVGSIAGRYLPERLSTPFMQSCRVDPQTRGAHLSAKALNLLVNELKGWRLGGVRGVPMERGEVVAGGISLDEVDPQTMELKLVKGLYLCGEVLDIAGQVGGYNLQAAWSTGYVAGDSAAKLPDL